MSFGAIFLLVGVLNRILYAIEVLVNGNHFSEWPVISQDPGGALLRGEMMTVAGTLLVVYAWQRFYFAKAPVGIDFMTTNTPLRREERRGYWIMYILPLMVQVMVRLYGVDSAGALSSLLSIVSIAALLAILALSKPKTGHMKLQGVLFALLLGVPYVVMALGAGMKENLIVSLIPLAIRAWQTYQGRFARVSLVLAGVVALSLITSFVSLYRNYVWYQLSDVSEYEVIQELALSSDLSDVVVTGGQMFMQRTNAMYHRGWAVDLGDQLGTRPKDIFGPLLYIFIPRFIWHDKPLIQPGLEHSALVFGDEFLVWSTSSTAAGFFPALYMGGGYLAVIFCSLGLGWMVAMTQRAVAASRIEYAASIYGMSIFLYALRLDEDFPVYMLSAPIINAVYILAFSVFLIAVTTRQVRIPYLTLIHKKDI